MQRFAKLVKQSRILDSNNGLIGSGELRVTAIEHGKGNKLGFGDLFRAVPLGGTTATTGPSGNTPGYPLCHVGLYLAEIKPQYR